MWGLSIEQGRERVGKKRPGTAVREVTKQKQSRLTQSHPEIIWCARNVCNICRSLDSFIKEMRAISSRYFIWMKKTRKWNTVGWKWVAAFCSLRGSFGIKWTWSEGKKLSLAILMRRSLRQLRLLRARNLSSNPAPLLARICTKKSQSTAK